MVPRCEERGPSSNEKSLQYNCCPDYASQIQLQKDLDISSPQFCGYSDRTVCDVEWTRPTDNCMAVEGKKIYKEKKTTLVFKRWMCRVRIVRKLVCKSSPMKNWMVLLIVLFKIIIWTLVTSSLPSSAEVH